MALEDKLNQEIRHIEAYKLKKLSQIIDTANAWKDLLGELSRETWTQTTRIEPLELSLDVNLIKQQVYCEKSPSLALLNHWAITGRRRPTVRALLFYLQVCKLKQAEDYVKEEILGILPQPIIQHFVNVTPEPIETNSISPLNGPGEDRYLVDGEFRFEDLHEVIDNLAGGFKRYSFEAIYKSTNKFCHRPYDPETRLGTRIGNGRFSSVFLAKTYVDAVDRQANGLNQTQETVAAKLLKSECDRKYLVNEINLARRINHPNILELLGISTGGDGGGDKGKEPKYICLIYPYMLNGSLLNCIASGLSSRQNEQLTWPERVSIVTKVARGIVHLHTFEERPIIHRDIKTANILIDADLEPKVGDFTLVRQLNLSHSRGDTQFSQNIIGTSVYMPQEAFRGDISTKFDTFSFGIVVLELLTGRRPLDEDLDQDLLTYITESLSDIDDSLINHRGDHLTDNGQQAVVLQGKQDTSIGRIGLNGARDSFLEGMLDTRAGHWNFGLAKTLFELALQATENRKKDRPELVDILPDLESALALATVH